MTLSLTSQTGPPASPRPPGRGQMDRPPRVLASRRRREPEQTGLLLGLPGQKDPPQVPLGRQEQTDQRLA
jgi:hypothetical protein